MDPEVHGFANSMVEPLAWPRSKEPFVPNGSHPSAHDVPISDGPTVYSQVPRVHKKKDIAPEEGYRLVKQVRAFVVGLLTVNSLTVFYVSIIL